MVIAESSRHFHLLAPDAGDLDLAVPDGVSCLAIGDGRARISTRRHTGYALEPLRWGRDARLLLLSRQGPPFRVNGALDMRVACLGERDLVQVEGLTLFVTLHVHTVIGTAPASHAGRSCPVCTRPVSGRVYICPACDTAVHCDPDDEAATCLLGSECPGCRVPILPDGPTWVPES